jgi:hypothetical protein
MAKMHRISEGAQKCDLFLCGITTERRIFKKLLQSWLLLQRGYRAALDEFKSLLVSSDPAVEYNLNAKSCEISWL